MAYGTNAPFGLRPHSSISGGSWTEKVNEYYIYADAAGTTTYGTSIFTGDPVIFNPAAATTLAGAPTIARYPIDTATVVNEITPVLGVFVGCEYLSTVTGTNNLIKSPYWPANASVVPGSKIKAFVIDDPDVVYDIQVSTATNVLDDAKFSTDATTSAFFTQNFAFGLGAGGANLVPNNPATGDTRTGQSGVYLNIVGTTATNRVAATLPLKTIGLTSDPANVFLDAAGAVRPFLNLRVTINNHISRVGNLGITPA
jgi:hypothetical protein